MVEKAYYTPLIEEFHVGFEYEANHLIRDASGSRGWDLTKTRLSSEEIRWVKVELELRPDNIRVKYLDTEDIESLGFIKEAEGWFPSISGTCWISLDYFEEDKGWYLSVEEEESQFSFSGWIKNKSELSMLLKNNLNSINAK